MLVLIIIGGSVLLSILGMVILNSSPELAAQGSDMLRGLIGDEAVSQLESTVFQVEDSLLQWRYAHGIGTPTAPWQVTTIPELSAGSATAEVPLPTVAPIPGSTSLRPVVNTTATPESSPGSGSWMPAHVTPLGSLEGEGVWSAYIQVASGQVVAYRTYLLPDPVRPYAIVGVIAFDLSQTRLHFVLGSNEPFAPNGPKRTGLMNAGDRAPGVLIAMFNGGFKARHGHFGAMAGGLVALPARNGLGTLAIYQDGTLKLGEWGSEITATPDMAAWRQNGPLVIQAGQINPRIYNNAPQDWGYTVVDVSPTWRSGIGLSADGKTLYYICGSSLSMEMLAKSMQAAGMFNAMQLDINNYWVHFVAVRSNANKLTMEPLFPAMMFENIDRYLYAYSRDYFYVTLNTP